MRCSAALAVALSVFAIHANAADTPQWPPPPGVESRMRELQLAIGSRESTLAQREAAREELSGLLKSPAGQQRGRTPDERPARPARAAIDPFPSVVRPLPAAASPMGPQPEAARMEVVSPPRAPVNAQSGALAAPAGRFAVDPRTGAMLHEVGPGFVDPRTGQFQPR